MDARPDEGDRQVADSEGHGLAGADRRAERAPGLGVAKRLGKAGLGQAHGERGDGDPAIVQDGKELLEPATARSQQVGFRHPAIVEGQAVGVGP